MPDTVIDRLNKLGEIQPEYFILTDRRGRKIGGVKLTESSKAKTRTTTSTRNYSVDNAVRCTRTRHPTTLKRQGHRVLFVLDQVETNKVATDL